MLDHAWLKANMDYSEGELHWRDGSPVKASKPRRNGYIEYYVKGITVSAHRLIYFYFHGELPEKVDHINGIGSDNHIDNLRAATHAQNMANRKKHVNNTSGLKGVTKNYYGRWRAQITVNNRTRYIGTFDTPEEAHCAYKKAAKFFHGDFANFG